MQIGHVIASRNASAIPKNATGWSDLARIGGCKGANAEEAYLQHVSWSQAARSRMVEHSGMCRLYYPPRWVGRGNYLLLRPYFFQISSSTVREDMEHSLDHRSAYVVASLRYGDDLDVRWHMIAKTCLHGLSIARSLHVRINPITLRSQVWNNAYPD